MQTIRTFIAAPLSSEITRPAARLIKKLKSEGDGIRWVPTDNLHLTLKFLGEVDNVEVPKICQTIRKITSQIDPFALTFAGTGAFPDPSRARTLYAGVSGEIEPLCAMVSEFEKQLAELGFKQEPRDYRPHLTLGRTRSGSRKAKTEVIERLQANSEVHLGEMTVDRVQLIGSFLDKTGPTYHIMDTIDLR